MKLFCIKIFKVSIWIHLCLLALIISTSCQPESDTVRSPVFDQHRTWTHYGGGPDQSKYVILDEINKSNVGQLEEAWYYPTSDNSTYHYNPIIIDGIMYVLANNYSLVALDAETGEEIWIHTGLRGISRRGINYWESEDREDRRLIFQMNNYLQAIDAQTGKSVLDFGEEGLVDLKEELDRDPGTLARVQSGMPGVIFENLIILGSSTGENYVGTPGHVRAYDVVTGENVWTFRTIPHPGEYGYDTWPEDAYKYIGGTNVWSEMSVDEERGIAYLPTGSPTYDFYGADRIGQNLFSNSLVAVDARTGERLWHYQIIHHDLWDYDLSSAPQLLTINHNGTERDVVALATKHGFLFVFDRETGEPIFDIEEKPVPPSNVPGEEAWPTQPHPVELPPFSPQTMTSEDINPYFMDDEEREEWIEKIDRLEELARTGPFVPLSHEYETLMMPGIFGGSNWGSTAANPEEGIMYILNVIWPSFFQPLERREFEPDAEEDVEQITGGPIARGRHVYEQHCRACHGVDQEGSGGVPSLDGLENRFSFQDFQQITTSGQGEMPAFSFLEEDEIMDIYRFLGGSRDGAIIEPPDGPLVASGGAPGGQQQRSGPGQSGPFGIPYPEDVEAPDVRYFNPDLGLLYPYVISPPWYTIVAYDLNEGDIKWERPLGQDKYLTEKNVENSSVLRSQRHGMIVTSSGLLFSTARDGRVYAFDAENGEELWSAELPTGTEGLPSLYEVNGRHYLVVTATTPVRWGRDSRPEDPPPGGYVVFALPDE